ncbi:unnamed protein product [Phytophthora lilii]|uniref:Unnamed protein product n=1 Tax=Phytophthora lilii TaxID=2077276 RepID=A0A9W6TYG6_9STRA|nr:unnamed protein product [Phytophthora lilii]
MVSAELTRRGVNPSDLVHLRAGWSLGGVQNTYLRYEAADDMPVGGCHQAATNLLFYPLTSSSKTNGFDVELQLCFKGFQSTCRSWENFVWHL